MTGTWPTSWPRCVSDEDSRRRKIDGFRAVERWLDRHPVQEWSKVEEALHSIAEGTWASQYQHLDDVTSPTGYVLLVEPGLVIVWREITEYPDWFRVLFVGHPDDQDLY